MTSLSLSAWKEVLKRMFCLAQVSSCQWLLMVVNNCSLFLLLSCAWSPRYLLFPTTHRHSSISAFPFPPRLSADRLSISVITLGVANLYLMNLYSRKHVKDKMMCASNSFAHACGRSLGQPSARSDLWRQAYEQWNKFNHVMSLLSVHVKLIQLSLEQELGRVPSLSTSVAARLWAWAAQNWVPFRQIHPPVGRVV